MSNSIIVPPTAEMAQASADAMERICSKVYSLLALNDPNAIVDLATSMDAEVEGYPDKQAFELAMKGVASFGAGLRAAQQTDFQGAAENFRTAVASFNSVGIADASSISYALLCYIEGMRNVLVLNLDRAKDLWAEAERHLKEEGGLQEKYRILLEQSKSDQMFISAISVLARQDYDAARLLLEEASKAANGFAEKYLSPEDPNYSLSKGMAEFYTGYYDFSAVSRDFHACGYERIIERRAELTRAIANAKSLLVMKSYPNELRRRIGTLAATIDLLQNVLIDFSVVMKDVMLANFNREQASLLQLRTKIDEASKLASALGTDGVVMLRQCEQLKKQVDNVESLTRPTVKDFGLFSGLVAMIAFVPLLFITSWVFKQNDWGAPPITLMWLNVGVACLVGFGAGALKLLPVLMGKPPKSE